MHYFDSIKPGLSAIALLLPPLILAAALLLAACGGQAGPPATPGEPPAPASGYAQPDDGAPAALTPEEEFAAALSGLWGRIDGSTATMPLSAALFAFWGGEGQPPEHNTTARAYDLLLGNQAGLIFVTSPSANELEAARERGVELEVIPVAKDALVFLVNTENPLKSITAAQLRDIYAGAITNWQGLGGLNEGIIPYQRTANSGSQTLLLQLVMGETPPLDPPSEWLAREMGILVESVANYDNSRQAIGYSVFYYVNNMYGNSRFKLLAIEGVAPSRDTIARGDYPLTDYYYAVMRKDTPAGDPARQLVEWLLTDEGQRLSVRAGYIPLRPLADVLPDGIDPLYLGDSENSRGTGGADLKPPGELPQTVINGVRQPLSDLFFDGFNYIQYINDKIYENLRMTDIFLYEVE